MTRTAPTLLFVMLAACGTPGEDITDALLAEYAERIEGVEAATAAYKAEVDGAADLDSVAAAQTTYLAAADAELEELGHALEGFHDCEMMGDADARVDLANATVTAMHEAIDGLEDAHAAHTDVAECQTLAADHETEMGDHFADLMGHETGWAGNMSCMGHEGEDDPEDEHDE